METQSRIFKVVVAFQEKDEVFYTRIRSVNGVPASLFTIICGRYPSLATLIKRCYVNDKSGAEFSIINSDDLGVFLEAEELFENVVRVEINGVNRDTSAPVVAPIDTASKRVRIEETQASPSTFTNQLSVPKETHSGVVCDCCDKTIIGFRYKCTECFNYDLCMTCEGKMRHCEHIMLRIPSPASSILPRLSHKDAKRFAKKHPETAGMGCGEQERSRHHHGKRHQRRCHRGANLFDGFFRQMTEDSPVSDVEHGTTTNQQETASTGAQQDQQQQQHAPRTNQPPMPPMYDFHKLVKVVEAVAGNVSKLFDPHGMSLETYADYGVNIPPTANTTTPAAGGSAPTSTPVNVSMEAKEQSTTTTAEAEKQKEATKPTEIPANMQTEQLIVPEETSTPSASTSSVPEPTIMDVVDDTSNQSYVIQPTTDTVPMCPPSPVNNSTASDDAEWLVISNEGMPEVSQPDQQDNKATQVSPRKESVASTSAQTTVAPSTENSAQTQGYDELAKKLQKDIEEQLRINSSTSGTQTSSVNEPIVYHPVPHINISIQKMMDMGFSNDGGCLTELMACCNGDIRRALDSLLYKK